MDSHNKSSSKFKIVNNANVQVIDYNRDQDNATINILRNEVLQLKATNASLNAKIQNLRDKHLPYIFLVDDNHDTIQINTDILHDYYNIIEAGNGIEALKILHKAGQAGSGIKQIDAIVLDINIPGMCGFTLCHEIKKKKKFNIPVIVCTARNTKKDVVRAVSVGADDYIIKPYQEKTLINKVDKWTKAKRGLPTR